MSDNEDNIEWWIWLVLVLAAMILIAGLSLTSVGQ